MNNFHFSQRSLKALAGVNSELVKIAYRALELTNIDFVVVEGVRSKETQERYVREGKSQTMNSRHLTGHAIDFVALRDGKATYDAKAMTQVALAFKAAAKELKIPVVWGGDWKNFKDTPHVELDRKSYP